MYSGAQPYRPSSNEEWESLSPTLSLCFTEARGRFPFLSPLCSLSLSSYSLSCTLPLTFCSVWSFFLLLQVLHLLKIILSLLLPFALCISPSSSILFVPPTLLSPAASSPPLSISLSVWYLPLPSPFFSSSLLFQFLFPLTLFLCLCSFLLLTEDVNVKVVLV